MAELNFTKNAKTNKWEAEATLEEPTPLFVKRVPQGLFSIGVDYHNDGDTDYAYVENPYAKRSVISTVLTSEFYPAYLKFVSESEVITAKFGL